MLGQEVQIARGPSGDVERGPPVGVLVLPSPVTHFPIFKGLGRRKEYQII